MSESNETQFSTMSLTDYARIKGISIQSVSQTFRRHQDEMTGMFQKKGRKTVLTPEGVKFLDSIREQLPVPVTDPETLTAMRDRIRILESQLEKERADHADEIRKKDTRIQDLEKMYDNQSQILRDQAQQMLIQSQQMLYLTTKAKKGVFQRMREWVTGTDGDPLPGDGNDKIIDK